MDNYNLGAKLYDPLLHWALKPIRTEIKERLVDHKDSKILDLCCGTGNQLKVLSKNGFNNIHGLDLSESMLQIAKKGAHDLQIHSEDATNTSFESESLDVVILSLAIHEKDRTTQENMLKEAYRILKTNGLLLIADYNFEKNTSRKAKVVITIIERIAGKEHYTNFKSYIAKQGLSTLIDKDLFEATDEGHWYNGICVTKYTKINP